VAPDSLVGPVVLAVNALLALAVWKWARRLFPGEALLSTLLHTLVGCWACLVTVAVLLGLAGVLSGPSLLLGMACVAGLLWIGLCWAGRPAPAADQGRAERAWLVVWGLLAAFWLGHVLTSGLLRFPSDWDSLTYHIPLIDQWLHAHSLYAPDCFHWSNPGNNELVGLWLVAPFSGDFLIGLMNLPAALLLACAAVELGRGVGLMRGLAHLAALAVVCNFVVLNQLVDAENDVAAAGLFLAALAYSVRYARQRRPADLAFAAVSVGLLAGVKFYALGYAALAGAVLVLLAAGSGGVGRALKAAGVVLAATAVWGGYWYVRNTVLTDSPLYPKGLTAESDVLSQLYPDVAHTSFLGNGRPELVGLTLTAVWRMTGPCQVAALVAAPLVLAWLAVAGWRRRREPARPGEGLARVGLAVALAGAVALWLVTPFAVEDEPGTLNQMHWHYCPVRYGLCFLSVAALGLAVLLQDGCGALGLLVGHGRRWRIALAHGLGYAPHLLLATAALIQLGWPEERLQLDVVNSLLVAGNLVLLAAIFGLCVGLWPRRRWAVGGASLLAALASAGLGCDALSRRWHAGFVAYYDALLADTALSELTQTGVDPQRVCVLDHRCYPFFGSARQFWVCQPLYISSPCSLCRYLRDQHVTVVVVARRRSSVGWQVFLGFDECRAQQSGAFRLCHAGPRLSLYKLVGSMPATRTGCGLISRPS
jgi:hypothetical protein